MTRFSIIACIVIVFIAVSMLFVLHIPSSERRAEPIAQPLILIAHGLGGYNGHTVTNTRSALKENYKKGYRWFEMDFRITRDNALIGFHDAAYRRSDGELVRIADVSLQTVREQAPRGSDLATFADALSFLAQYPDMYLILDPKDSFIASHRLMNKELRAFEKQHGAAATDAVRKRIVPQFYVRWHYIYLKKTFNVPMMIFTLYRSSYSDAEVLAFVRRNQVSMVTMHHGRYSPVLAQRLKEMGITAGVHTLNDETEARRFMDAGAVGIYTDWIQPGEFTTVR